MTVEAGNYGPPCGTVYRAGVNPIIIKQAASLAGQGANPGASVAPPPATPVSAAIAPIVVPAPSPAPPVVTAPPPAPPPVVALPLTPLPATPTPVTPTPPGGAVAQSPSTAKREERARKHAQQSAFAIRPAGTSDDWFYELVGAATILTLLLVAAGTSRANTRFRPAYLESTGDEPRGRRRRH